MFPKDRGTQNPPKWMVYNGSNPIKMDDLGGFPIIFGSTPISEVLGFSEFESIINFIGPPTFDFVDEVFHAITLL